MPALTRRRSATAGVLVGLLLAALDGTVVATAMPKILHELRGVQLYSLAVTIFMVFQTVAMPIWGRLSDLYGRPRFHLLAVIVLVAGSVLCGTAGTMVEFILWRAVQGIGAGGLMSLSFTMIADLYDHDERAKMQGAISSVWGIAALAGPLLGGWITDHWTWRAIFYLNVPVGLVSALQVQLSWERREAPAGGRMDVAGAVLLALAAALLMTGFNSAGRHGWGAGQVLQIAGGALLGAALLVVERRQADPFLAYDLFRSRLFATGAATGVCAMVCLFAATLYVPLWVAGVLGRSLRTGGLMLTCMMGPWMVCSALTKPLLTRFSYRTLAATGLGLAAAAYGILASLETASGLGPVIGAMSVLGTGLGLTVAPLLIAAQNAVPRERLGAATSLTQFTRSLGAAVGLAVMGTLFTAAFGGREPEGVVRFRAELDAAQLQALLVPLAGGLTSVWHCGVVFAALGFLLALAIPAGRAADLQAGGRLPVRDDAAI